MWQKIAALALAGAAGTLCRVGMAAAVGRVSGDAWGLSWGTLTPNALGCLLFGAAWAAVESRFVGPAAMELRLIVLGGFLGAFTTFSTYAFEVASFGRGGQWWLAAVTLLLHNAAGLAMMIVGLAAGRWLAA